MRGENGLESPKLNNSHFSALMKRPSGGPSFWMMESTFPTAGLGPATAPSSMYHLWNSRLEHTSSIAKAVTSLCNTRQKNMAWGLVGCPAGHRPDDTHWTPLSRMRPIIPQSPSGAAWGSRHYIHPRGPDMTPNEMHYAY